MHTHALHEDSRIWLFVFERHLSDNAQAVLQESVRAFLDGWRSHGTPVQGSFEVRFGRILIVSGGVGESSPSGCAIDTLFRQIKMVSSEVGTSLVPASAVTYVEGGVAFSVTREQFGQLFRSGAVTLETQVLDTAVTTVKQLQAWQRPVAESWHREIV
jgi:hypothetical protein